ncbi:hypothetical protein JHK82_039068 [Glycine max]|uniref:Uncharacterized protein n=2 Tax=Glycine subgen. Soja TaxID=1462606 RepID=K7M5G1_SOYBN|nr:hypothetical protein JHK86_039248 [Glycine max]KHN20985.1 hypothetical protein glysoja_009293 [Glycine soja]KAG4964852.1 hypothetical protein JHK85_039827 [Glycine max]KAG5109845.1 hypothetical protein JHK82_039068 [Glycine max]KAG5121137.1 hypothetical protein JHK84_039477 [Glycine max]
MSGALAWRVRKALIKINIVFCFGEGRFRGCFFFFLAPILFSLYGVVVFFPFLSFPFSLLCPVNFSIL